MHPRTLFAVAMILVLAPPPCGAAEPDPPHVPGREGTLQPIDLAPATEEYHPVKKPLEPMQYFPDEVERA
ncbi:MAG: hypothetical protein ACE5H5_03365, partial [Nitrospinota bacterium]